MKTIKQTNRKQIEKAVLKSIFTIFIIAAVGITVNGQNFWASVEVNFTEAVSFNRNQVPGNTEMRYSTNEMAKLMHVETESPMELEDWMVSENYFGNFVNVEVETEKVLKLEDWMTNDSYFDIISNFTALEKEDALELETWMTDENYFADSVFQVADDVDDNFELESWMVNADHFGIITTKCNENCDQMAAEIAGRF